MPINFTCAINEAVIQQKEGEKLSLISGAQLVTPFREP